MKIATWNLQRLKHFRKTGEILALIGNIDADVLILTETDEAVNPGNYPFSMATKRLKSTDLLSYKDSERRVSIHSKFEIVKTFETCDPYTGCCAEIYTPAGNLRVYGTITGIFGNRHNSFKTDLLNQAGDFKRLSQENNLCIAGDYNVSFSDNYYFTNFGRNEFTRSFHDNNMTNLTQSLAQNIDHIAISSAFIKNKHVETFQWNTDKKLSDHKGVGIRLTP